MIILPSLGILEKDNPSNDNALKNNLPDNILNLNETPDSTNETISKPEVSETNTKNNMENAVQKNKKPTDVFFGDSKPTKKENSKFVSIQVQPKIPPQKQQKTSKEQSNVLSLILDYD